MKLAVGGDKGLSCAPTDGDVRVKLLCCFFVHYQREDTHKKMFL